MLQFKLKDEKCPERLNYLRKLLFLFMLLTQFNLAFYIGIVEISKVGARQ